MSTPGSSSVEDELSLAASSLRAGEPETALTHLKSAVAAEPSNEIALGMLGSVYVELGMADRAAEFFDKVLAINPANPLARFQSGLLAFDRGELERALKIWKAQEPPQDDFMIRFYSGLALAQLGRADEARALYRAAQKNVPADHPVRTELEKLLSEQV